MNRFRMYGVSSLWRYCICRVIGHDMKGVGIDIHHNDCVEKDEDCARCGIKVTRLVPHDNTASSGEVAVNV